MAQDNGLKAFLLLVVTLGLLVTAIVGFVPTLLQGQDSANDVAHQLLESITSDLESKMDSMMRANAMIVDSMSWTVRYMGLPPDIEFTKRYFAGLINTYLNVTDTSYFYIGTEAGEFYGLESAGGKLNWRVVNATFPCRTLFWVDPVTYAETLPPTAQRENRCGYNPTKRGWYKEINYSTPHVSLAYAVTQSPTVAVSFGHNFADAQGRVIGVVTTDVSTVGLTKTLQATTYGKTGAAMIIEVATGNIIAVSSDEIVVSGYSTASANNVNVQMKPYRNTTTPVLVKALIAVGPSTLSSSAVVSNLRIKTDDLFVAVSDITLVPGNQLRYIVALPLDDFLGDIRRSRDQIIVVVSCVSVAVIAIFVGALYYPIALAAMRAVMDRRADAFAPKEQDKQVTIVFTDIQASTNLWAKDPEAMGQAIDTHHRLMRLLLDTHQGYEVKTIGDSFMCAFSDVANAVQFALAIQEEFFSAEFAPSLDRAVREKVAQESGQKLSDDEYSSIWSGLRVRVGVHYGALSIQQDPTTRRYDYYGTVVNTAARVESVAHGGQVVLTEAAYNALLATNAFTQMSDSVAVTDLGPQPLRGLPLPVQLIQLLPRSLERRKFPPLRLDVETVLVEEEPERIAADSQSVSSRTNSVRSVTVEQSLRFKAELLAKRSDGKFSTDELEQYARLVRAMLAPGQPEEQAGVVKSLAALWRIKVEETANGVTGRTHNGSGQSSARQSLHQAYRRDAGLQSTMLQILSRTLLTFRETEKASTNLTVLITPHTETLTV